MLGHASAAMTLDRYAGLFADGLDSVARRLDELVRDVPQMCHTEPKSSTIGSGTTPPKHLSLCVLRLVGPVGLEPTTRGLKVRCSAN